MPVTMHAAAHYRPFPSAHTCYAAPTPAPAVQGSSTWFATARRRRYATHRLRAPGTHDVVMAGSCRYTRCGTALPPTAMLPYRSTLPPAFTFLTAFARFAFSQLPLPAWVWAIPAAREKSIKTC